MALLTAAELKASREAVEAGVDDEADAAATAAISEAVAVLHRALGYRIEVTDAAISLIGRGGVYLFPAERVRGLTAVTEDGTAVTDYLIENDGWTLRHTASYWTTDATVALTGTFGFTSSEDEWILAKRAVLLLAVRQLQSNDSGDDLPSAPAGTFLSSFSSQDATFTFDRGTEGETLTGYSDVDRLIDAIGPIKTYA